MLAINHLAWVDIPLVGALSPRNINYVAKVELRRVPGARARSSPGTGSSPSAAASPTATPCARCAGSRADGRAIGVFVEGTRQKTGRPGRAQPGAAMVAIQEDVPVVPVAVYGTQFWKLGNFAPCSIAVGEPFRFDDVPKGGRGYKEASAEIERRLNVLFDWLADVHARGRPRGETPPL